MIYQPSHLSDNNKKLRPQRASYFIQVLKSHYCQVVFGASLFLGYFLIPKKIFYGYYTILGIAFIISFSLVLTCLIRQVKERVKLARTYSGAIVSIIATAVGLAALEACGIGAPVCGAVVGLGFLSIILPVSASSFVSKYSIAILVISIIIQFGALYFMNCFKKVLIISVDQNFKEKKMIN